jgi:6-phosphogluconolactonase (cycloisomerase 2 family)
MRRLVPPLVALAALLLLATAAVAAPRLYVPEYYGEPNQQIGGFERLSNGQLTPLAGSPFPVVSPPLAVSGIGSMAFTPDGRRAAVSFYFDDGILGLSVAPSGAITPSQAPLPGGEQIGLAITPDGRFAYAPVAQEVGGFKGVRGYSVGATGALTPLPGSPYGSGAARDVAITPDGRFLFVTTAAGVGRYAVGADGSLAALGTTPVAGARTLQTAPNSPRLFVGIFGAPAAGVLSFAVTASGGLVQNGPLAPSGDVILNYFTVSPDGRFVYLPDSNEDAITTAAVGPDGSLAVVGAMPADDPYAVAVSPDGRYLYWEHGGGGDDLRTATIGADGVPVPTPLGVPWESGEPERLVLQPLPVPVASFTAKAAAPGAAASFNAAKSTGAGRYDWNFGDGTVLPNGGPNPTHAYAKAGKYTVTLSAFDEQGCGAAQVYTGQSTVCPGGSSTTTSLTVDTLPAIRKVKATPKKFLPAGVAKGKSGTKLRVKLSEAAQVRVKIEQRLPGRKVGRKCKKPTPGNASKKKCSRYVTLGSRAKKNGKPGWNEIAFNGKLKGKPLDPGGYRITAVATDSAQGRSAPRSAAFRVLPY